MSAEPGAPPEPAAGAATTVDGGAEIPPSAAYRISLPDFEGPLDLLLHLCKTHEIDILNIPIAFVTEKYLEYLEAMEAMSVEVAAEYLVMAATLAYLKSRELVPSPEPLEVQAEEGAEEAGDPKEELIRRLLEYQKYKDAAEQLGGRPIEGRNVFGRGMPLEGPGGEAPLAEHSVWKLIECFADLLKDAGPKVTHDVVVDRMSITERINQLIDRLEQGGGNFRFDSVVDLSLPEAELRHQIVVTLLAILELAKLKVIRVLQDRQTETFFIAQREGAPIAEARRVTASSDRSAAVEEEALGAEDDIGAAGLDEEALEPLEHDEPSGDGPGGLGEGGAPPPDEEPTRNAPPSPEAIDWTLASEDDELAEPAAGPVDEGKPREDTDGGT
jgi:segregation and condensation protein A